MNYRFLERVKKIHPEIPHEVIEKFGFLRLTCRRKGINEYMKVQKKERKKIRDAKNAAAAEKKAAKAAATQKKKRNLESQEDEHQWDKQERRAKRIKIYK